MYRARTNCPPAGLGLCRNAVAWPYCCCMLVFAHPYPVDPIAMLPKLPQTPIPCMLRPVNARDSTKLHCTASRAYRSGCVPSGTCTVSHRRGLRDQVVAVGSQVSRSLKIECWSMNGEHPERAERWRLFFRGRKVVEKVEKVDLYDELDQSYFCSLSAGSPRLFVAHGPPHSGFPNRPQPTSRVRISCVRALPGPCASFFDLAPEA